MKNSNDTIGNRTRDLPACSAVPRPTAPTRIHRVNETKYLYRRNQQDATMYQNFVIPYLYEAQHVSYDTPLIIRSLNLHWQSLVFYTWKVVCSCSWWTFSGTVSLCLKTSTIYTYLLSPSSDGKPEAATAVVVAPDDGHEDARNMFSCI
jgi:hypothetical protein